MLLLSGVWAVCLLTAYPAGISGHVRLQYPVARNFALDALGNKFTGGACGMPRDPTRMTDIKSGSTFNVTWNLGSTHDGGLRVELLDTNYNLLSLLVPRGGAKDDWYGLNPAPTMQEVTLPQGITCQNCVIRVLKLGALPAPGDKKGFYFTSCGDVNVVDADVSSKCSGRGKWAGGACTCQKPYVGDVCQYAEDCFVDSDCAGHGSCIDTLAQSYPKKQCYCSFGWHGRDCSMESSVKTPDFNPQKYMKKKDRFGTFTFYWRILVDSGEIEVVIVAKSKTWVALGWRPAGSNTSCKAFPEIQPDSFMTTSADGTPVNAVIDFMDRNSVFFTGPLHPMACNDIVVVATRGNLSRIQDAYTRDHSTPREDEVFGGTDSLTGALAFEDPVTNTVTAIYRKTLTATEPADVSISDDGQMHVIWAVGQEPYDPTANSAASNTDKPLDHDEILKEFPRKGELNSHKHMAASRGFWEVNLRTGA